MKSEKPNSHPACVVARSAMRQSTATRASWILLAIAVVILTGAAALSLAAHHPSAVLPFLPALLVFAGVGAVVASRRPANPVG